MYTTGRKQSNLTGTVAFFADPVISSKLIPMRLKVLQTQDVTLRLGVHIMAAAPRAELTL